MATTAWILIIAAGIALGFFIGRLRPASAAVISELQRERDAAREELRVYRAEVDEHFGRTAQLFDKVTGDYRELYEHLALGARQLSALHGEATQPPLERPELRQLAPTEPTAPADDVAPPGSPTDSSPDSSPDSPPVSPAESPPEPPEPPEPETHGDKLR